MSPDLLMAVWLGFSFGVVALVIGFMLGSLTRLEGTLLDDEEEDHAE